MTDGQSEACEANGSFPRRNIDDILKQRGKRYGDFKSHAAITQAIKQVIHWHIGADNLRCIHREALDMIAHKIGRIVNGDPNYADSWDDIAGYAKLVADEIRRAEL